MDVQHIDHINIRIPTDGVDDALAFYRDCLGFVPEQLDEYRKGERTIFTFRLSDHNVIHIRPKDDFEAPSDRNYDHAAIVLKHSIDEIKSQLEENGIEIERESNPLGATGRAPAVYVRDPFGYLLELKVAKQE